MIDVCSITYPQGVKNYINRNDYVQDILLCLCQNRKQMTAVMISNELSIPSTITSCILRKLFNYGIVTRCIDYKNNNHIFSYSLQPYYYITLLEKSEKNTPAHTAKGVDA